MLVSEWLIHLPVWLTFLLVIAFWMLVAMVFWWIGKRFVSPEKLDKHKDTTYRVLVVISAFYAFMLGFIVSQEWNSVNTVRKNVARATASLYTSGYSADEIPSPYREKATVALRAFAESIICEDIPALARTGEPSKDTNAQLRNAISVVSGLPSSVQDGPTYTNMLRSVDRASEERIQWVSSASMGLPPVVLAIIFLVAIFLIGAFSVQMSASHRAHLVALLGIAAFIGLGTGLVIALNRPFVGAARVDPAAFTKGFQEKPFNCAKAATKTANSSRD